MSRRKWLLTVGGGVKIRSWLLRDEFATAEAAPIATPHTAEPGPGSWTVVQNDGAFGIVGGELVVTPQTTPAPEDLRIYSGAIARAAGVALATSIKYTDITKTVGYYISTDGTYANRIHYLYSGNPEIRISTVGAGDILLAAIANGQTRKLVIVLRATGAYVIIDDALYHVSTVNNVANLRAALLGYTDAAKSQYMRAGQLGSVWTQQYGPGRAIEGVIAAATTFVHAANALIYFTVTNRGTAGSTIIKCRIQDADNYWRLTIGSDGSLDLSEVVATVATSRGTAAAGTVTNGERCSIRLIGTTIYVDDISTRITYASATNFQIATNGELTSLATDAVITTLEIYPVNLSGNALKWIQAMEVAA